MAPLYILLQAPIIELRSVYDSLNDSEHNSILLYDNYCVAHDSIHDSLNYTITIA